MREHIHAHARHFRNARPGEYSFAVPPVARLLQRLPAWLEIRAAPATPRSPERPPPLPPFARFTAFRSPRRRSAGARVPRHAQRDKRRAAAARKRQAGRSRAVAGRKARQRSDVSVLRAAAWRGCGSCARRRAPAPARCYGCRACHAPLLPLLARATRAPPRVVTRRRCVLPAA